jgi:GT2 family glycosyltransferase
MDLTIAIATYNRVDELRTTLTSLSRLETTGVGVHEILIVDNNSSDGTSALVQEMAALFGKSLRYVLERNQGLSHARNRAIAEAQSEVIAFLDDDVDVDPGWLAAHRSAHASDDFAAVGGKTYLIYPGPRPEWLGDVEEAFLSKVDLGPMRRQAKPTEVCGVNLSFKKAWLKRVGPFRTDLGRIGRRLLSNEETEFLERLVALGGKILYEPAAVVGHRVAAERLRPEWFLHRRYYWQERSDLRIRNQHLGRLAALRRCLALGPRLVKLYLVQCWRRLRHDATSPAVYTGQTWWFETSAEFAECWRSCLFGSGGSAGS